MSLPFNALRPALKFAAVPSDAPILTRIVNLLTLKTIRRRMNHKELVKMRVDEVKEVLESTKDSEKIVTSLHKLAEFLPGNCDKANEESSFVFVHHHYARFLYFLLDHVDSTWETWTSVQHGVLDEFFVKGTLNDSLIVLNKTIGEMSPSYKLNKCIDILEKVLQPSNLIEQFVAQCKVVKTSNQFDRREQLRDETITILVSLPERIANKLERNNRLRFYPNEYFVTLSIAILRTLEIVREFLVQEKDCSLKFLSQLFGRCCSVGQADIVLSPLVKRDTETDDFIWRRLCQRLMLEIPNRCMESALYSLVRLAPRSKYLQHFLGNAVVTDSKVELVLTQKFLLFRTFNQDYILRNILEYIAETESDLLLKVFKSLLSVWRDKIAITHTSYEQHDYITRGVIISAGLMKSEVLNLYKNDFVGKLMNGVSCHLSSPHENIRLLGMVTAECLTQLLDPNSTPLKFEYKVTDEVLKLKALLEPVQGHEIEDSLLMNQVVEKFSQIKTQEKDAADEVIPGKAETLTTEDNLDSDDDLEPYDLTNDVPLAKVKKPSYLRDCLDGLIDQSNPEHTEICLENAEYLIRKESNLSDELAVDVAKALFYLQNSFVMPQFSIVKHNSLVSTLVCCPIPVANYLTKEFYDSNNSIRQRLDVLDILSAAAKELSRPNTEIISKKLIKTESLSSANTENWREIIQRRIESKTKRFGKTRQETILPAKNRFAAVAGYFFFPLMKNYDNKQNTFDLLGDDCLVLGKMLFTLGSIVYAAMNAPIVTQMGKSLLDFLWTFRFHVEPYIRKGIIFCLCMILLALPSHTIYDDMQTEFLEFIEWLKDVASKDVDQECNYLANQALLLCQQNITKYYSNSN